MLTAPGANSVEKLAENGWVDGVAMVFGPLNRYRFHKSVYLGTDRLTIRGALIIHYNLVTIPLFYVLTSLVIILIIV